MQLVVKERTVLPYGTGRYVTHEQGDVILQSDLHPFAQNRVAQGDAVLMLLLEKR